MNSPEKPNAAGGKTKPTEKTRERLNDKRSRAESSRKDIWRLDLDALMMSI
jgi:hypothetical protein